MSEILNTGIKLWSIKDDYDMLQTQVFEELTGTGGKSNMRIINNLIEDINSKLSGYYFEYSDDRLYICKKNEETEEVKRLPVNIIDNQGHIASKVDGTTITIDENGVVKGISVDTALSATSTNPVQNKVINGELDTIKANVKANETAISSEKTRAESVENQVKTELENGKKVWDDKYTKAEVDNKLSAFETALDWKESVDTYEEILSTYPNPEKGWTVNTTDTTYRYDGEKWVDIGIKSIPKSTHDIDGLMSKEDKEKLDGMTKYTPDGTTITVDADGTIHGVAEVTVDTEMSATSTNPVQNKVVNTELGKKAPLASPIFTGEPEAPTMQKGDNTNKIATTKFVQSKADTLNYDKSTNTLYLKSGSTILSSVEIKSGGGGATITPKPTVNPQIKNNDKKVIITWEDPTDTVIEGSTFSRWAGTKLVMKESGYPTSPDDGTVLTDNSTRDKYKVDGFVKSGLTNDKQYYFALFPYSTDGIYNYDSGNRLLGEPTELKIVTFADGTDEEITEMIQAHYNDKIDISDYWAVGDTRSVNLSAMPATGVGESHRAQTVQFVIGDFEHDDLVTPINGHTKAAITLLQKDCLMDATSASNSNNGSNDTERGYMNSSNTNVGGWKNCARRTWCNNVYFNALPSALQSIVKNVNKKVSVGNNQSTIETVQDKIFLAAEIEIFGYTTYSFAGEGTQYQYYKNATANRYKMPRLNSSHVTNAYWERSPYSGNTTNFYLVYYDGYANYGNASYAYGVAPCLCI